MQYHPEASPGPHDSHYLFREFVRAMKERRGPVAESHALGLPPAFAGHPAPAS